VATCIVADVSGVLSVVTPQPADVSACTYVVVSGAEVSQSPWLLTIEQAHQIGLCILLACAIAWGFRLIAEAIRTTDEVEKEF
jgi:hypothetical protein